MEGREGKRRKEVKRWGEKRGGEESIFVKGTHPASGPAPYSDSSPPTISGPDKTLVRRESHGSPSTSTKPIQVDSRSPYSTSHIFFTLWASNQITFLEYFY